MVARFILAGDDARGSRFEGLAKGGMKYGTWFWDSDQNSSTWKAYLDAVRELGGAGTLRLDTKFTAADVKKSDWAMWHATGFTGYPQPEDRFKSETFDRTGACDLCNDYPTGKRQIAPFRMRGEPPLGRRSVMQMHWVYDAWFVTNEAYASVFEPFGIHARPALTKGGREIMSVVQLVVDEFVPIDEYRTEGQLCSECGTFRLHAKILNYAPLPLREPVAPLAFTSTSFGGGGSNFHETLIRRDLREAIQEAGLRGTAFHPCGTAAQRQAFGVAAGVPADLLAPAPIYHLQRSQAPVLPNAYALPDKSVTTTDRLTGVMTDEAQTIARADRARRLLAKAQGSGTPDALVSLGIDLFEAGAEEEALVLFGRAAQAGHATAMSLTARLLKDDDPAAAEMWWRRAIDSGGESARYDYGCYLNETGQPERARELWESAVEHDDDDVAMVALAQLAWSSDFETTRAWLERAADRGNALAHHLLGVIARDHEFDLRTARRRFEAARDLGYADSQDALDSLDES
jgi:TPR repeat protein